MSVEFESHNKQFERFETVQFRQIICVQFGHLFGKDHPVGMGKGQEAGA